MRNPSALSRTTTRPAAPRALGADTHTAPTPFTTDAPPPEPNQADALLTLLYRGRWFIFLSFLTVLTGTAVYTYLQVPQYRASSLVLVDRRLAPDLKDALDASPNAGRSAGRSVETEIYVLERSLDVAHQVAERLQELHRHPDTGQPIALLGQAAGQPHLAALVQFAVSIQRQPVADVLEISATSFDPAEAQLLANLYAEELVSRALARSRSRLSGTRTFLENEANERNRELRALEEQMKHFMSANGALTLGAETTSLASQATDLEAARDEIDLEIRLKQVAVETIALELDAMPPKLAARAADTAGDDIERAQLALAEAESRLELIYRQNPDLRHSPEARTNPTIQRYERQIADLEGDVSRLTEAYIDRIVASGGTTAGDGFAAFAALQRQLADARMDIRRLAARRDIVESQLRQVQARLGGLPEQQIAVTQLQRSLQTTERAYLFLREKLEEIRIAEESEQGYAELIRRAGLPIRPEHPDTPRNLILGGLVGLLLGLGLAVLYQQRTRDRIFSPDDLLAHGYTVLGVIPRIAQDLAETDPGALQTAQDPCLIDRHPATSRVVDAYRRLRFTLLSGRADLRTILVTSPNPGEGKSLTALNLAIAMAQAGRRTIVIDTDLRCPTVHHKLGIAGQPGFTEMMTARHLRFRRALKTSDNLFVLTAGGSRADASEILASDDMPLFIEELKRHFDTIIFDSPPYQVVSDAMYLASLCEGTVVVAAAGRTRAYELRQGLRDFHQAGCALGVVLNAFDPSDVIGGRTKYRYYHAPGYFAYEKRAQQLLETAS